MRAHDTVLGGFDRSFPPTSWSAIFGAARVDPGPDRLDALVRAYWRPVYAYVRTAWHKPVEDAKDLTQAFFTRLLEKKQLAGACPERGRFRSWLLTALRHFLIDARRAERAQRRGGGRRRIEATPEAIEELAGASPRSEAERAFDREWVHGLLAESVAELRASLAERGRSQRFEAFRLYCLEGAHPTYGDLGVRLGLGEGEVRHALEHARRELRGIVRRRLREHADDDSAVCHDLRAWIGK